MPVQPTNNSPLQAPNPKRNRAKEYKILKQYRKITEHAGLDGATRPDILFNYRDSDYVAAYGQFKGNIQVGMSSKPLFSTTKNTLRHELKHAEQEIFILRYLGFEKFKAFCAKQMGISKKDLIDYPGILNKDEFNEAYYTKAHKKFGQLHSKEEIERARKLIKATVNYPSLSKAAFETFSVGDSTIEKLGIGVKFLYTYYTNLLEREARKAARGF